MALIAYYTGDAGTLPAVNDVSGNARHGTAVGNVTAAAGRVGAGLQLGGDDDYVEVPHDAALALSGGAFTIAAWIFPTGWGEGAQGRVLAKGSANPSIGGGGWTLALDQAEATIFVDINAQGRRRAATNAISLSQWTHVAARLLDGDLQLFVAGVASGALHTTVATPGDSAAFPLRMGIRAHELLREFVGIFDEVRIYDEGLTDQQIAQLAGYEAVAIDVGGVALAGQDLTAVADAGVLVTGAIAVTGQDLTVVEANTVSIDAGGVEVAGRPLGLLRGGLFWRDQVSLADRFAPLATPAATWLSARFRTEATMTGPWVAGGSYAASPVNPHSYRTDGGAWIDIPHPLFGHLDFDRGVTIWIDLVLGAITERAVIFTTGGGSFDGEFSLEVQPPANGSLLRAWFVENGTVQYFGGSSSLTGGIAGSKITPGAQTSIAITMGEAGAAVAVNGVTLATLAATGSWRKVTKRFGAWTAGTATLKATLGDLRFSGALDADQLLMMRRALVERWSQHAFGVVSPAPGRVLVAGQSLNDTVVAIGAGAVIIAGRDVVGAAPTRIDAGSVAIAGQSLLIPEAVVIGAGAVALAGKNLGVSAAGNISIAAAGVAVAGKELTMPLAEVVAVAAGAVTVTGKGLAANEAVAIDAGAVAIAGQDLTTPAAGISLDKHTSQQFGSTDPWSLNHDFAAGVNGCSVMITVEDAATIASVKIDPAGANIDLALVGEAASSNSRSLIYAVHGISISGVKAVQVDWSGSVRGGMAVSSFLNAEGVPTEFDVAENASSAQADMALTIGAGQGEGIIVSAVNLNLVEVPVGTGGLTRFAGEVVSSPPFFSYGFADMQGGLVDPEAIGWDWTSGNGRNAAIAALWS